jgi:hypothetical protein
MMDLYCQSMDIWFFIPNKLTTMHFIIQFLFIKEQSRLAMGLLSDH